MEASSVKSTPSKPSPSKNASSISAEQLLRNGLEAITEAFERKSVNTQQEVNHWKQIAGGQRQQIVQLETEMTQLQRKVGEFERQINDLQKDKRDLQNQKQIILDKYNNLKKTALQLETFRKQIVGLVEFSPADLPDNINEPSFAVDIKQTKDAIKKEESFLETLHLTPFKPEEVAHHSFNESPSKQPPPASEKPMDAPTLYKKIRSILSPADFDKFATAIAEFNSGVQTADETISKVSKLIKDPRLVAHMKTLIMRAISETSQDYSSVTISATTTTRNNFAHSSHEGLAS